MLLQVTNLAFVILQYIHLSCFVVLTTHSSRDVVLTEILACAYGLGAIIGFTILAHEDDIVDTYNALIKYCTQIPDM